MHKAEDQHQLLTQCPGMCDFEQEDLVIPAAGMTQRNCCPPGELGRVTATVNVGFMEFCISSPCGGLAEGTALSVKVSLVLAWCVHLAHRWCEGGISPSPGTQPYSVVLVVTQSL